jgi:uncharacterized heparinase superfamily protein
MDCGTPPPGPFSVEAHAGCLAFEFSTGTHRIVVNCGAAKDARQAKWENALRVTAAHSTLALADTSESTILDAGWARNLLGARLLGGVTEVETSRIETSQGWSVKAAHNGYVAPFGVQHERQVTLSVQGTSLAGIDRVVPKGKPRGPGGGIPFSVRFHIHPDIRVSSSQGGDILLKLPGGEGWRFRAQATIATEESIYLGTDMLRRTEQLVLSGTVRDTPVEIGWLFEQIGRE